MLYQTCSSCLFVVKEFLNFQRNTRKSLFAVYSGWRKYFSTRNGTLLYPHPNRYLVILENIDIRMKSLYENIYETLKRNAKFHTFNRNLNITFVCCFFIVISSRIMNVKIEL